MLNVNIPSLEVFGPVKGYHMCSLGTRVFGNKTALVTDPMGTRHGWIGGRDFSLVGDEDSDCRWLAKGYVTLSLLSWGNSCLGKSEAGAEWAREVEDWLPNG
jgi:broad specificity polyphosphatase/5'/3'-nucleotidase SurE